MSDFKRPFRRTDCHSEMIARRPRRSIAGLLLAGAVSLAHGQVVGVSDLGSTTTGTMSGAKAVVKSGKPSTDLEYASSFTTGAAATTFDSITFPVTLASGTGLTIALYSSGIQSNTDTVAPAALIETLTGPSAPPPGNATYTASTPLTLSANTIYWWVASVPKGVSAEFDFDIAATPLSSGLSGWTINADSSQASEYTTPLTFVANPDKTFEYSVEVTQLSAVPEPSTYALLAGGGSLIFAFYHRRRTAPTAS